MLKQEALFVDSLIEKYGTIDEELISIDHEEGICEYDGQQYSIIFPREFIKRTEKLKSTKIYKFCFVGVYTNKREWIKDFENKNSYIKFTNRGRTINKHSFDDEYYKSLCQSEYCLCPEGDFTWTYRFLESIMCKSIPVVTTIHSMFSGFIYSFRDGTFEFSKDTIDHNYNLFLERHVL